MNEIKMNEVELSGLVHNNRNLVRLANKMRSIMNNAHEAILATLAAAVPISEAHEETPTEYVINKQNIDLLMDAHYCYHEIMDAGWWSDQPPPSILYLQHHCGCCGADRDPGELEEHIGLVMYCRHCLDNDLVAAGAALDKVCADLSPSVEGRDYDPAPLTAQILHGRQERPDK